MTTNERIKITIAGEDMKLALYIAKRALEEIAFMDYRGNESQESAVAKKAIIEIMGLDNVRRKK